MFAFISNFIFLFAGGGGQSGFAKFYQDYLNIPGFEAWKFFNLGIFIALMVYILKKPLTEAFKARRESIRAELIKAEEETKAALAKLTTVEAKLAQMESEKEIIIREAKEEAANEKKRLTELAKIESERLRLQSEGELSRLVAQTRAELRRFSAEESIRLAEEKLRSQINLETDTKLVKASIQKIGGLN